MTSRVFNSHNCFRFMCGPPLFILVLFLVTPNASAIPLSDYQKNLERAITALDTLAQRDEDETHQTYEKRLTETIGAVRNAIPEKQSIEQDSLSVTVDNAWLHKRLDELEVASESDAPVVREQLIEGIKAIDERVVELQKATVRGLTKEEANERLAGILSRSEYESSKGKEESAIKRLLDRLVRWLASILPQMSPIAPGKGSIFTKVAQIFVIGLALAVLVYVAIKLIGYFGGRVRTPGSKKKREPRIVLGERLEPEASATDLLSEAEALARKGELRAAIRKAYIALLVELGDRNVISLAQYKTNRDYLRQVRPHPSLYTNMSGLTDSFERHWYGFA